MADCVIILKSGVKIEIENVIWGKLMEAITKAQGSTAANTNLVWDDFLINLSEVAAIYTKGKGIKSA